MVAANSATCGASPRNPPPTHSTLACLQTDCDFAGFIIGKLNAGLLKDVVYLEDRGEVSFHDSFILLDPLEGRQPDPGSAGKLALAPAQKRARRPYLGREYRMDSGFFPILSLLTTTP